MATDRQQRLQEVLERLVKDASLSGALLVSRDGFCMMNLSPRLTMPDTFSAMSATLVAAAEAAVNELGEDMKVRVVLEAGGTRMFIRGVTAELLVVALADLDRQPQGLDGPLDAAIADMERLLGA